MRQIIAEDRRKYEKRKKAEAAAERQRLERERLEREREEQARQEEARMEEVHRRVEAEMAEWRARYDAADDDEKIRMSREQIREMREAMDRLFASAAEREERAKAQAQETEQVWRKPKMTMFNLDDFKKDIANDFRSKASSAARATRACREGVDQVNKDAMVEGYKNGLDARGITEALERERKDAQLRFKDVYESGREAASAYVDNAFALNPAEYEEIAPMLSVMKLNESDVRVLLKEHGDSWTKRRAIVDAAVSSGVKGADFMKESMSAYEETVRRQSLGIFETASKGVLGSLNGWDTAFDMRLDSMESARSNLDVALGLEKQQSHWLAETMENAAWSL